MLNAPSGGKRKLNKEDAILLLKLNELQQSDRVYNNWTFSQFEFKAKNWDEFVEKYPTGSKGFDSFYSVSRFLELAGVLVKYNLLSEDLFFDTFWFEPIWKNFEPVIKSMREKMKEPSLEENFEYLYKRFQVWKDARKKSSSF